MNHPNAVVAGPESPLPQLVATVYAQSPQPLRSKVLACLLGALGPLAMAALSEGSFARFLLRNPADSGFVTAEDVVAISQAHVLALARYVSEACPVTFVTLAEMLQSEAPTVVRTLAGGTLVLLIRAWMKNASAGKVGRAGR